jgi:predicted glycogen debranching enzyme
MIRFGPEICNSLEEALSREWLETNGRGGFASGTVSGAHTRRYHGLLIATTDPPVRRNLLLSKIEETIVTADGSFELSCNLFPGAVHPEGFRLIAEFRLDPWPTWRFQAGAARIDKSVFLVTGENTAILEYRLSGANEATLQLRPLVAFRDYHSCTHANQSLHADVSEQHGVAQIQPYPDLPALYFGYGDAAVERTGDWYYRFQYHEEKERGLDFEEDLFQPFTLTARITPDQPVRLIVSTAPVTGRDVTQITAAERARRVPSETELLPALTRAARQFFIARGTQQTVIAGYHWFTDWGRDTMIALPGLARAAAQPEAFRSVLLAFLPWFRQGLLPNRFPDAGAEPEYNSTDATLWFVEALRAYAVAASDDKFVREHCWDVLHDIVEWLERGTLFGIRIDTDGLLTGGEAGVQLTWMDAKVGDRVITERAGKPVEIQALWYNALCTIRDFAGRFDDPAFAAKCDGLAERARVSFNEQFWNSAEGCLFDVVNGADRDGAIRPNQLFAFSLPHCILNEDHRASVLDVVTRELLTPLGLRTLSPRDSRYQGHYDGDQASRDGAYHQGTVWPWLLGPYVRALWSVRGRSDVSALLEPFRAHLLQAGLGQVSEIFDGDPPHAPRGCIAQAWSVAELIEIAEG